MSHAPRLQRRLPALLGLGLGLSLAASNAPAQLTSPSGTNISTGSGAGTGTMQPTSPNQTELPDMNTPRRPAPAGGPGQREVPPINPALPRDPADMPSSPGELLEIPRFPDEDTGPLLGIPSPFGGYGARNANPEQIRAVEGRLFVEARGISDPADRSLAFDRTAQAMILVDRWDESLQALDEGGRAARNIVEPVRHDIRLQSLVGTCLTLAEELTREATISDIYTSLEFSAPTRTLEKRLDQVRKVRVVAELAARLADQIRNDNYAAYALAQVAEAQANNSAAVAIFATKPAASDTSGSSNGPESLNAEADAMLIEARQIAWANRLSVWRDQTLVKVVGAAASAAQFDEGARIARSIPHAEARADAQTRLAEAIARRGRQQEATVVYQEAMAAVLAIPLEDPRQTIGAVLLDSLLSVGRFEDSRITASLILKPEVRRRALGAIAKSMGERGLADEAVAWIDSEAEPILRDRLRRELNEGLTIWLQQNRTTPGGLRPINDLLTPSELEGVLPRQGGAR